MGGGGHYLLTSCSADQSQARAPSACGEQREGTRRFSKGATNKQKQKPKSTRRRRVRANPGRSGRVRSAATRRNALLQPSTPLAHVVKSEKKETSRTAPAGEHLGEPVSRRATSTSGFCQILSGFLRVPACFQRRLHSENRGTGAPG